jgi:hypothetical protein
LPENITPYPPLIFGSEDEKLIVGQALFPSLGGGNAVLDAELSLVLLATVDEIDSEIDPEIEDAELSLELLATVDEMDSEIDSALEEAELLVELLATEKEIVSETDSKIEETEDCIM